MTPILKSLTGLAAVAGLALLAGAASAQVTITKYGPANDTGSDVLFTGPSIGSFTRADGFFNAERNTILQFNSGVNASGNEAFGLDVTGNFTISPGGLTYTFLQGSDDGSYSFLTGPGGYSHTPLIAIPGPTNFKTSAQTLALSAGVYSYEIHYSESNGPPGSLQFTTPVPEPSPVAAMGVGGGCLLGLLLRARKAKRAKS